METRRKEAAEAMAAGAKHEKTTLTKWKPDWESALAEYERAGTCFKGLKDHASAGTAFAKAANAAYKCEILAAAGKHYESAAQMHRDAKDLSAAADMYDRSAACYFEDGSVDRGADVLVKGARVIEDADAERATSFIERAVQAWKEDDTKPIEFSVETYKAAVSFHLRARRLREAIDVLEELLEAHAALRQPTGAAKCALSIVVARLHADDYMGAHTWLGALEADLSRAEIARQEEVATARELLDAFASQSDETLAAVVGKRVFIYLDAQALKLARELTLQAAAVPVEHVGPRGRNAAPTVALESFGASSLPLPPPPPLPGDDDDDDDEGGAGTAARPALAAAAAAATPAPRPAPQLGDFGEVVEEFTDDLT
ncbi:hypothetical protein KFE25_005497 [Diacronema lutheri]|uniref:Gamma-soluble NSF attachment protein n=1 Tax=Diacronema lutheri TaxID=2081491 RepID=A0A8J5XK68_DIALT|nr:hypothetical protein KFE25_005497 [Diacronema lutheri]